MTGPWKDPQDGPEKTKTPIFRKKENGIFGIVHSCIQSSMELWSCGHLGTMAQWKVVRNIW